MYIRVAIAFGRLQREDRADENACSPPFNAVGYLRLIVSLLPLTVEILKQVESDSGIPVEIQSDPNLPGSHLAEVRMARGEQTSHLVLYKPDGTEPPDYLICYQCGFILRLFRNKPTERFDLSSTAEGDAAVLRSVTAMHGKRGVPAQAMQELATFIYNSHLRQLRSYPIGFRVDRWIRDTAPELIGLKKNAAFRQLRDNAAIFRPEVNQTIPEHNLKLNHTLNAAFAIFWAEILNQPELLGTYESTAFLGAARKLIAISDSVLDDPGSDCALVNSWAKELGMMHWYRWTCHASGA